MVDPEAAGNVSADDAESMRSYVQLLNTLHLPVAEQPQEGQQAFEQAFQQMSQQLMEQAEKQQQAFQQLVQQSLAAYMERLRPSR